MFTPRTALTFDKSIYSMDGISKETVENHLKLYQGYVNKYNEINTRLGELTADDFGKANQVYSLIRELKVEMSFAWGGIINHEIYFGHLGGKGGEPEGGFFGQIKDDFGSFEEYRKDLKASGLAARGWVWTGWNRQEKRLVNYVGDSQNTYLAWFVEPIVALDTYEHAYFQDYGVNRGSYIDAFLANMNWSVVEDRFEKTTALA